MISLLPLTTGLIHIVQVCHYAICAFYWALTLWDVVLGQGLRLRYYSTATLSLLQIGWCVRKCIRFLCNLHFASKFRELREPVQTKLTETLSLSSGSLLKGVGVFHHSQIGVPCHDARLLLRWTNWLEVALICIERTICGELWCVDKVGFGGFEHFSVLGGIQLLRTLQNMWQMVIHRELYLLKRFFLNVGYSKQVRTKQICLGLISIQLLWLCL